MRVAVTGSSGLVGGQVCTALLDRGHEVVGLVRRDRRPPSGVKAVPADLRRPASLEAGFAGAETVVHCAAVYAYGLPAEELHRIQVQGTRAVITAASVAGVRRVVVTASSVVCGSSAGPEVVDESHAPGSEYAPGYFLAKQAQEQVALEFGGELGVEVVVACPTLVLGGPSNRLVPSNAVLARYLLDPSRTTYAGGVNVVAAPDVGVGHALLAESGQPGLRYLLGGRNLSWRDLHGLVSELAGTTGPFLEVGPEYAVLAAQAASWWARVAVTDPLVTPEEARTVGRYYWYRHDRAAELGYAPRDARATVAHGLAWLLVSGHISRWVREGLRPLPEVHASRTLVPRPLPQG